MTQDLMFIAQQAIGQVGGDIALVIAAAAGGYLIRFALRAAPKARRARRLAINVGTIRIVVTVAIGRKPKGRGSISDADG